MGELVFGRYDIDANEVVISSSATVDEGFLRATAENNPGIIYFVANSSDCS